MQNGCCRFVTAAFYYCILQNWDVRRGRARPARSFPAGGRFRVTPAGGAEPRPYCEVWAGWSVGAAYMPPARLPRYAVYGMICGEGVLTLPRYPKTNRTNTKKARPPLPGGRAECANVAYSAWIAPVGQTPSQAPQSTQEAASTTALSSMVIAPTGQVSTHAPQATHSLETV